MSEDQKTQDRIERRKRAVTTLRAIANDIEGHVIDTYVAVAVGPGGIQIVRGSIDASLASALDYLARRAYERLAGVMDEALHDVEGDEP